MNLWIFFTNKRKFKKHIILLDIEELVQSSKHGVVVVSFGSNVQYLPDQIVNKLVNVFRRRNELFLMRY